MIKKQEEYYKRSKTIVKKKKIIAKVPSEKVKLFILKNQRKMESKLRELTELVKTTPR